MTSTLRVFFQLLLLSLLLLPLRGTLEAQIIPAGSGSYTTTFPGVDAAGRNTYPSGNPYLTGNAVGKPVPTNDWWSAKVKNPHADNLFNYPYTLKTVDEGLVVSYIPWGVIDNILPVVVGVSGLNASAANISDYSDWTITMDWQNGNHHFQATSGIGMPFLYFEKDSADLASITVNQGTVVVDNEMLVITDARNGADFAVFAPTGSSWTQNGNVYSSTLNGKNYWSLAFIPLDASNVNIVANEYKQYAYVFPTNTTTTWNYDEASSLLTTDFVVTTEVKEGSDTDMLIGLLPHQWANLAAGSPIPNGYSYASVRGELKTLAGNSFSVSNRFHGILPTLPYVNQYSESFSPALMASKTQALQNDGLNPWTDSYNEGQMMNRLIQTARIADMMGDTIARDKMIATVKERLEDWLSAEANEVAFIFYYNQTWTAMLGYPAGHGQDGNINDHHFHWGYFIHAAAFMEQFEPGWASQWGDMVQFLIRDAACPTRDDPMFPMLRNFSPYAGHCWANGFASFPQGNDQESTSESMQFNSSLIHWGAITGNDSIRDLGIYLYTTEQTAIEEYWFDTQERNFQPNHPYSLVSRVWGNSYDNGTFWTSDIAASYGIELYPIHGGSLYLGHDTTYTRKLWNEMTQNTGILNNEVNVNLWHDVVWKYLALIDPEWAIQLYDSYPERDLKFGVSDAHTYHWLHAMNSLGQVDTSITANSPLAVAFSKAGQNIYVAHNYGADTMDVLYSDGYILQVPPASIRTSLDISLRGTLSSNFPAAYPGGKVTLDLQIEGGTPSLVEFFEGDSLLGQLTQAPFSFDATDLQVGRHTFYAKIYDGTNFNLSNLVGVVVGEQLPYTGYPIAIPGDLEAGRFDIFEGGNGQGIAYNDASSSNGGNFRETEFVDASIAGNEGAIISFINAGEWLEYTVEVAQAGLYDLNLRYASGNSAGGGPLYLLSDGDTISPAIGFGDTGDWDTWANRLVTGIPLKSGRQILRIAFEQGEFNLGRLTFTYSGPLPYDQPIADAGENILVQLPQSSTPLDASMSSDPGNNPLTYEWTQIYGPSTLSFTDPTIAQPTISTLEDGVYLLQLKVDNGMYSDIDEIFVISNTSGEVPPKVSILSPADNASFFEDASIDIAAVASDLIGNVVRVDFYADSVFIGSSTQTPYETNWMPAIGNYEVTAVATDDDSSQTISKAIQITIEEAPSCKGTAPNGDFLYEFSDADNNPTLTFIPSIPGVGSPTCILYYGTDAGALPGYGVTPNVPFQLNAAEGSTIYFYYTYSYPGQGEKNNADNKISYLVGSCKAELSSSIDATAALNVKFYPNPVSDILHVELPQGQNEIIVYSLTGQEVDRIDVRAAKLDYDMSTFEAGVYLFKVRNGERFEMFKVLK